MDQNVNQENNKKRSNWKGRIQIKATMTVAYVISLFLVIISLISIISYAYSYHVSEAEVLSMVNDKLTMQAVNRYLDTLSDDESEANLEGLNGGPLDYMVMKATGDHEYVLYQSADFDLTDDTSFDYLQICGTDSEYNYTTTSALGMFFGDSSYYSNEAVVNDGYTASQIVYGEDGLFYAYFERVGYLRVDGFTVEEETDQDYREDIYHYDSAENAYLNANKQKYSLKSELENLGDDAISYAVDFSQDGYDITNSYFTIFNDGTVEEDPYEAVDVTETDLVNMGLMYYDGDGMLYWNSGTASEGDTYSVYVRYHDDIDSDTDAAAFKNGTPIYYAEVAGLAEAALHFTDIDLGLFIIGLIIFIPSLIILCIMSGHRKNRKEVVLRWYDKIPYLLYFILSCGLIVGFAALNVGICGVMANGHMAFWEGLILNAICYVIWSLLLLDFLLSLIVRIKAHLFWRYSLCYYISRPIASCHRYLRGHMGFFWCSVAIIGGLSLVELIVIACTNWRPRLEMCLFILYKLVEIPVLLWAAAQLKALFLGGERVAKGNYSQPINTKHMLFDFKKHGENLNHVSDGISYAVDERLKSEHFQTELITNVSHDIKTPLTSIINYVDLLQKLDIQDPTEKEYLEVLSRQSARLKTLIEDLIEASKASSGAITVNMEKIDAVVMLDQVIGEFGEKLEKQGLTVVVNKPEPPVSIQADGRHFWRILDNLLGNICKYAQPGTRVYVDLAKENGWIRMTFRNISKEQLNITSEELMQRFVRGDSSRNTEGNGLGLNIASSLATLMGGNMAVQIDGDLFKVNLFFPEDLT